MTTTLEPVDIVIIGGGFTGLTMAKELCARTSLSVLVLERGSARSASDYAFDMDELDYAVRLRMMQNLAEETVTHRHSTRARAVPVRQYGSFLPGTGVGGSGEHWQGLAWRFLPEMFRLRSHLAQQHGASRLPGDLEARDWGVTYDEIEQHYWHAEQMLGVSGQAGNLRGRIIRGGNPFEGPRTNDYPLPPLKPSYLTSLFREGALNAGLHSFRAPSGLLSEPYKNPDGIARPACEYCGFCERFGCMVGAKAQPTNILLPVLYGRRNFELRTGSWVRRILHKNGRVSGVRYADARGRDIVQPASVVVLASWTLNNVRLLYLSRIGTPYDPVSRTGTLGRNLTHQVLDRTPIFVDKPLNRFMGSGALVERVSDYDTDRNLTGSEGVLRLGALEVFSSGSRPIASFGAMPNGTTKRNWGSEWKAAAVTWYDRSGSIQFAGEHLAWRQNFMDLDPTYTDKFGDPLLRFTLDWTEHEHRQRAVANQIARKIAMAMGPGVKLDDTKPFPGPYNAVEYQTTHIQGGAMMGVSPESSVVSTHLQHWDLPDLWVIGASAFPQNPSHNPTLTALALTTWSADALIGRYLKNPGKLV
jgi:gluconate 2-dehydrogenase alpha chain